MLSNRSIAITKNHTQIDASQDFDIIFLHFKWFPCA
jgi:hypothetical protein